jgi:stage III sporulation protein SpoIIIAA
MSSSSSIDESSIRAVEQCVRLRLTPNGWARTNSVGGLVCAKRKGTVDCAPAQWQAIIVALRAKERVGSLEIDTSFQWLRIRADANVTASSASTTAVSSTTAATASSSSARSSASSPDFSAAVASAIDFVKTRPLCTMNLLAKHVAEKFSSAAWAHVKTTVVNNSKCEQPIFYERRIDAVALDRNLLAEKLAATAAAKPAASKAAAAAPPPPAKPAAAAAPAKPAAPAAPAVSASAAPSNDVVLVNTRDACATAVAVLRATSSVGINCQGSLDDALFQLRLVQVGVPQAEGRSACVYQFDLDSEARSVILDALRWLLQAASVRKVFHDLRREVAALSRELQLTRKDFAALFDTQVLFELLVENGLAARHNGTPLADVLRFCGVPVDEQKQPVSGALWRERVLPNDALQRAAIAVRHLVHASDAMLRALRDGVPSWSARYAVGETLVCAADHEDPFTALCRLEFAEPTSTSAVPRAVAHVIGEASASATQLVGVPPASEETIARFAPEFGALVDVLPRSLADFLRKRDDFAALAATLAVLLCDAGEPVELHHRDGRRERLPDCVVSKHELNELVAEWRVKGMIGVDNRVAVGDSLHRVSARFDGRGNADGLTCRVGRHMPGAVALLRDVVARVALGASLLLLGPPGSGKTTLLREIAQQLADAHSRRVNVIDASGELAGDGDRKHWAIGNARRTVVPFDLRAARSDVDAPALVMREAIANHAPEVLVVDELGTKAQAAAAAAARQRGIAVVASGAACDLAELRRNGELGQLPAFEIVVELKQVGDCIVHMDAAASLSAISAQPNSETQAAVVTRRWSSRDGSLWLRHEQFGGAAEMRGTHAHDARRSNQERT